MINFMMLTFIYFAYYHPIKVTFMTLHSCYDSKDSECFMYILGIMSTAYSFAAVDLQLIVFYYEQQLILIVSLMVNLDHFHCSSIYYFDYAH